MFVIQSISTKLYKPSVAKKFKEFCKLMNTTPGKVMCGFVEQIAKDKDLWEEILKGAKN